MASLFWISFWWTEGKVWAQYEVFGTSRDYAMNITMTNSRFTPIQLPLHLEDPFEAIGLQPTADERRHAELVRTLLALWQAPEVSLTACLAVPFLKRGYGRSAISGPICKQALDLAAYFVQWQSALASQSSGDNLTSVLGRLYREVYLEIPELPFTLLLLADHGVSLSTDDQITREAAVQTQKVFAPLAGMLGIWSLYRSWTEKSYEVLFPEQYAELKMLLGDPSEYLEKAFRAILRPRQQAELPATKATVTAKSYLRDKAEAFLFVKKSLRAQLDVMNVKSRIVPIAHHAGLALRRVHEGESSEDVARRLSVRIFCRSVADCYTTLGAIHRLGKPVSIGSSLHFKDHIASPQPNGYQSLHATITLRRFREDGTGSIVVECRILTNAMHRLNEKGLIVARRRTRDNSPQSAWWQRIPDLERHLSRSGAKRPASKIHDYLLQNEPHSVSEPIYVFTPRGEIVLLPNNSTPLDFAYNIHTQMGHHALRVVVNGKSVPYAYPLRNGDIVRVRYDANFSGPDLSWLGFVKTSGARASIQRWLKYRANSLHPGRAYFEEALLKIVNWYEREKNYKLTISTRRAEEFLIDQAKVHNAAEVRELYAKINANNELTTQLVQQLVSSELASSVVTAQGDSLTHIYEHHRISICMNCRPSPGNSITGLENSSNTGRKTIIVHDETRQHCTAAASELKRIPLRWAEPATSQADDILIFRIRGMDRPGLLKEALTVIYETPKTALLKVDAQTNREGQADIALMVSGQWFGGFDRVVERLGRIAGIQELGQFPPSPSQRMSAVNNSLDFEQPLLTSNPYTSEEVFQRGIFFNRQDLLQSLSLWLKEEAPYESMILHGQRRVGKTSLVKYFMNEYLIPYGLIRPIFVDFQALNQYSSQEVASLIVRKVHEEGTVPEREEDEPHWQWANRAIRQALKQSSRLLIIIDEFNFLIEAEKHGKIDPAVYDNLRSLMNGNRNVNWLLVVQDTHYFDRDMWKGAGPLLQKTRELTVKHLERDWAKLLILEPSKHCGVVPKNEKQISNQIFRLTTGSPFLIHLICHYLVKNSSGERFDNKDVSAASNFVVHIGKRYFAHFTKNLVGIREVVMAGIAFLLKNRKSCPESDLFDLLNSEAPELHNEAVKRSLQSLEIEGQITYKVWGENSGRRITIPIELYRRFITEDLNLAECVEKWRTLRRLNGRQGD
jgi:GTP pyrophosphokinase